MHEPLGTINGKWNMVSRLLLGSELGDIGRFEPWLSEFKEETALSKSSVSGIPVCYSATDYCKGSRRLANEEIDFSKKAEPLSENEIKDIDSLIGAVSQRAQYAGNIILGNSKFVEKSSSVIDSHWIYESANISDSKYMAYVTNARFSECIFGGDQTAESAHCIRSNLMRKGSRLFEAWQCDSISDCIYVQYLENCHDCAFCFNLKNTGYCIGNRQLPKEKYLQVRESLGQQIADEIESKKRAPSLISLASNAKPQAAKLKEIASKAPRRQSPQNKASVEKAFYQTSQLLLGKPLLGLDGFEKWLLRHTRGIDDCKSCASGSPIFLSRYSALLHFPKDSLISLEEAQIAGKELQFSEEESLCGNLEGVSSALGKIGLFCPERNVGTNTNIIGSGIAIWSSDCYRVPNCVFSKDCAYSYWPRNSQYMFGCAIAIESSFCINCYRSQKLTRCLECDSCRDCADSYYLHNCENVRDSMFCFNAKNLQYAIGNAVLGKEKFLAAKKMLLGRINFELEKKKDMDLDIYNLACRK